MSRDSGPAYISEADARAVVQARYPRDTLRSEGSACRWSYWLDDEIVAVATLGNRSDYWRLEWRVDPRAMRADREFAEPTYTAMEDAVRELDSAPEVSAATRRTVNRMRIQILTYRELARQDALDVLGNHKARTADTAIEDFARRESMLRSAR